MGETDTAAAPSPAADSAFQPSTPSLHISFIHLRALCLMTQNHNIPSLLSSAEKEICKRLSKTNKAQRNDNVKVQKIKLGKNGIPRRGNADGLVMLWVFLHILPPQHLHQVGHLLFVHLHPLRVALFPHRPNRHFALSHSLHLKCLPCGDEADCGKE